MAEPAGDNGHLDAFLAAVTLCVVCAALPVLPWFPRLFVLLMQVPSLVVLVCSWKCCCQPSCCCRCGHRTLFFGWGCRLCGRPHVSRCHHCCHGSHGALASADRHGSVSTIDVGAGLGEGVITIGSMVEHVSRFCYYMCPTVTNSVRFLVVYYTLLIHSPLPHYFCIY